MNESINNTNNNILKSNNSNQNINPNLMNSKIDDRSNNYKLNNNNQSILNSQRQNQTQSIFSSPSSSPNKRNNNGNISVLNKTFSNTFRPRYNINNMQPINEESELNSDDIYGNIDIPQLPDEIINQFSKENFRNYKIIINFLNEESKNILQEKDNYLNKKNANNKLNIIKESGDFSQYNNVLEEICKRENNKTNQYLKDLQSKSNIFELIKNNCQENFDFILKYYNRNNIVNNKLGVLITHINDYRKHFYSKKYNHMDTFDTNNSNIDNILNNTFNIERRNDRLYNLQSNENILITNLNNNDSTSSNMSNVNNILNNTNLNLNQNNNRLFYSSNFSNTAKSTAFNSKFFNTFSHL